MSIDACAESVRLRDPDRFQTALLAPASLRGGLMVLYAFNLEIARAPWVTNEPMIAEMRLQFWADVVSDIANKKPPRVHEVAGPLADLVWQLNLPVPLLQAMVQARRFDIYREPFQDIHAVQEYTGNTAGNLMWLAAKSLGAPDGAQQAVRQFGGATGVAALILAQSDLVARGHAVFAKLDQPELMKLAQMARTDMRNARGSRRIIPKSSRAALLVGWQADSVLKRAIEHPSLIESGTLESSEFSRRAGLILRSTTGYW